MKNSLYLTISIGKLLEKYVKTCKNTEIKADLIT